MTSALSIRPEMRNDLTDKAARRVGMLPLLLASALWSLCPPEAEAQLGLTEPIPTTRAGAEAAIVRTEQTLQRAVSKCKDQRMRQLFARQNDETMARLYRDHAKFAAIDAPYESSGKPPPKHGGWRTIAQTAMMIEKNRGGPLNSMCVGPKTK
jgi:hypothetical protein